MLVLFIHMTVLSQSKIHAILILSNILGSINNTELNKTSVNKNVPANGTHFIATNIVCGNCDNCL